MSRGAQDQPDVYTITSAAGAHSADMQQRATRYLISMGIRTACVILVIVIPGPLRWVFAVGAVILPYIAVVAANASGERREPPMASPAPGLGRSLTGPPPFVVGEPVVDPVVEPVAPAAGPPPDGVPHARSTADRHAS